MSSDGPTHADESDPVPGGEVGSDDSERKHWSRSSWLLEPDIDLRFLTLSELLRRQRLLRLAARPADAPIRSRQAFHSDQRKKVCEMALENPSMSHQELADYFVTNKTTITRTLKQKDKWLQSTQFDDIKIARDRGANYTHLEFRLERWFGECVKNNVLVTDAMIKEKAMGIARGGHLIGVTGVSRPFACSAKWLKYIKSRYGLVNGRFTDSSEARSRRREKALGHGPDELDEPSPEYLVRIYEAYQRRHPTSHAPATKSDTGESLDASHPLDTSLVYMPHDDVPLSPTSDIASAGIDSAQSPAYSHDPEPPSGELVHCSTSHAGPSMSPQSSPGVHSPNWLLTLESTSMASQVPQFDWTQVDPQSNAPLLSDSDMSLLAHALTTSDLTALLGLVTPFPSLAPDITTVPTVSQPQASGSGIDIETLSTDVSADEMFLSFMLGSSPPPLLQFPMDPSSSFSMDHTTTFTPEAWANPLGVTTELPYSQWPAPDFVTDGGSASEEALQMTTAAMCDGQTDFDAYVFSSWPDVSESTGDMCTPLPFELTEM